jgi:hypothetical protein
MAAAEATNPSLISSLVVPEQYVLASGTTLLNTEAAAIWEQALAKARDHLINMLSDPNREALFTAVLFPMLSFTFTAQCHSFRRCPCISQESFML